MVEGLLVFDYKTLSKKSPEIQLIGKNSKKVYASKKLVVSTPKGLTKKYNYYDETIDMLEK
jgi:hypothetical protein